MAGYIGAQPFTEASYDKQVRIATEGQTTFNVEYSPKFLDVLVNGVELVDADYVAVNGSTVVLNEALEESDEVIFKTWGTFNVADTYTQAEIDSTYGSEGRTQSATDTTAGRLLKVGDFGVGGDAIYITDLTAQLAPGFYTFIASVASGSPETQAFYYNLIVNKTPAGYNFIAWRTATTGQTIYFGSRTALTGSIYWQEIYHTGNEQQIGVNQTWQDVTASRSAGVTYTNTTGKPIMVACYGSDATSIVASLSIYVDGVVRVEQQVYSQVYYAGVGGAVIVPNGSTYRMNISSVTTESFHELR